MAMFDISAFMQNLKNLVDSAGVWPYVILLAWTFLEGETIVIIAGIAAKDGTPNLWLVILAAFAGSLASDQLMFFLGRYKGKAFIAKRPAWQKRSQKVLDILHRHQTALILGFRFLYGLRNVTPLAIGMSKVSTRRFVILNVTGAAVWACTFAWGGCLLGRAMANFFEKTEHQLMILAGVAGVVLILWLIRLIRRRRAAAKESAATVPPEDSLDA
ncbi:MAG: DedA family protein [Planctomycetota bacterium]|nr:DedA family protein [Planctomycetota bacterium]